jgi:drug/metabolite transporter (DMT)-like permease
MCAARVGSPAPRTAGFTLVALIGFAANSWLCRGALRTGSIDPTTFTAVRILCGAVALALIARLASRGAGSERAGVGGWRSAAALIVYALAFSLAYLRLDAGVGALVLFGAVQITMLVGGILAGHRPHWSEGTGLVVSFGGLTLLAGPGAGAADRWALGLMAAAGVAWGIYSLRGRNERRPLAANARNFLRATPLAVAGAALAALAGGRGGFPAAHATSVGMLLAAVSGAVTSGLGYAAWYAALPGLSPVLAGLVQMGVPVLAAAGGVALLAERPSLRLAIAGALVLAGIALAIFGPRRGAAGAT